MNKRKGENKMITFGPVPSRRLGHSLGINNIPPKICTYSCVYCQLGRTLNMQVKRNLFYKPEEIFSTVEKKVRSARDKGEFIDYLTFVADGEPTLDINLGKEMELLKSLNIRIAVITNASLIWDKTVQNDLVKADWISFKIDAVSQDIWKKVNRPHSNVTLNDIFNGMMEFSRSFKGELTTETMLVQDVNDRTDEIEKIAGFVKELNPVKSYLSIPTRPPAEKWVQSANEFAVNEAYHIFNNNSIQVEYLVGYEGNEFAFTGNVEDDLLSITSVHPMREEGVNEFLTKAKTDWSVIKKLIIENKIVELHYKGNKFYVRKFVISKDKKKN